MLFFCFTLSEVVNAECQFWFTVFLNFRQPPQPLVLVVLVTEEERGEEAAVDRGGVMDLALR